MTAPEKPATTVSAAAPARTAPDVAPQTAPAEPSLVRISEPGMARPDLRKQDLIAAVLERCEIKKRDAKPVIEAMLAVLGEALAEGRGLNLAPMGKLRINRIEEKNGRRIVVCKLRQGRLPDTAGDPDE
ncbi:HU family DNA-binding protein [Antarcticimicrobium luteum]|nr:HU family DNA-binding protein [Antarcticimicrobium luteum]